MQRDRRARTSNKKGVPQRIVSMPAYLTRFRCIGGACENTCCSGWVVPVDPKSHARYSSLPDSSLRKRLLDNLVRVETGQEAGQWSLRLRESDNACDFLSPAGLCTLQQQRGPDFLCITCATYPRVAMRVDGQLQRAAVLSCPEAARLALFSPRAMSLVRRPELPDVRDELAADITTSTAHLGDPMASFDLFRSCSLDILRAPRSLEERLVALGHAFAGLRAERLYPDDVRRAFSGVVNDMPAIAERVRDVERCPALLLPLLRGLAARDFFDDRAAGGYRQIASRVQAGLGADTPDASDEAVLARFEAAAERLYKPYMAAHPYVMGNFLTNFIYATAFPFAEGKDPFVDYLALVMRYCLLKVHLIGSAAAEGKLNDALVVAVVHRLERAVNHNQQFRNHVLRLLMNPETITTEELTRIIVA